MRWIFLTILCVLVAGPVQSADWLKFGRAGDVTIGLSAGEWAQTDVTTATDDAAVINVQGCENFDVFQFDDPDGDGAETITGTVEMCPGTTSSDAACAPLPNTSTFSGDDAIYGAGAIYIRIEASGADAGETDGTRWQIRCAQPSGR